ncbi:MAG: aldehyde dehydrogenase family protein [Actinobacteria bacterium]|nr:aldehyde dehydrogenase family protein [Actinomycetota bacterium]
MQATPKYETRLFIDGEYVHAKTGKKFRVYNPATEEVIAEVEEAGQEDVNCAVEAARRAFDSGEWSKMDAFDRGQIIKKFGDLIEQNIEELALIETLNNGKPLVNAKTEDLPFTVKCYRYYGGWCDKIKGSTFEMAGPYFGMTKKEPVGVVGQIIPWNYPLLMQAWKMAPALATGCTIVIKPAEQTPLTALKLGKLINDAGFPKGVINIISGDGKTGAFLTHHPNVDKIAFTGSTEVGYKIMKDSHQKNLKRITLELGGKSANIIFEDAKLDLAVPQATSIFNNAGQSCIAGSRTFVHEAIYDEFVKRAIAVAKGIKVGDPLNKETNQGPQVSKEQFDRVMGYIKKGQEEGAVIVTGGKRVGEKGFFIEPTIFIDVKDNMTIAREEIFGPVMCILKFKSEEEAITRANSSQYGLGAGIVTESVERAMRVMTQLKAGTVYVNCYDWQDTTTPFGGYKDSGVGRELGEDGLNTYLETKTIILKK